MSSSSTTYTCNLCDESKSNKFNVIAKIFNVNNVVSSLVCTNCFQHRVSALEISKYSSALNVTAINMLIQGIIDAGDDEDDFENDSTKTYYWNWSKGKWKRKAIKRKDKKKKLAAAAKKVKAAKKAKKEKASQKNDSSSSSSSSTSSSKVSRKRSLPEDNKDNKDHGQNKQAKISSTKDDNDDDEVDIFAGSSVDDDDGDDIQQPIKNTKNIKPTIKSKSNQQKETTHFKSREISIETPLLPHEDYLLDESLDDVLEILVPHLSSADRRLRAATLLFERIRTGIDEENGKYSKKRMKSHHFIFCTSCNCNYCCNTFLFLKSILLLLPSH